MPTSARTTGVSGRPRAPNSIPALPLRLAMRGSLPRLTSSRHRSCSPGGRSCGPFGAAATKRHGNIAPSWRPSPPGTRMRPSGTRGPMSGARARRRSRTVRRADEDQSRGGSGEMVEPTAIQADQGVVLEPVRRTPIVREVDVLVCGGGVSGVGAALGAARTGAKAMVLERNAFLGGAATAVIMNTWNVPVSRMTGVTREIARELTARGAGVDTGPTFPFDPEAFKEVAVDLLRRAGVEILNYTTVVDPIMEGNRIRGVVVQNKSGRQAILARTVVDTTGDADIAAAAGAEYVKGREQDGKMRPMSVLFRVGGVDVRRV